MIYVMTAGEYSDYEVIGVYKGPSGADIAGMRKEWEQIYREDAGLMKRRALIARQHLKESHPDFEELEWEQMWVGEDWGT